MRTLPLRLWSTWGSWAWWPTEDRGSRKSSTVLWPTRPELHQWLSFCFTASVTLIDVHRFFRLLKVSRSPNSRANNFWAAHVVTYALRLPNAKQLLGANSSFFQLISAVTWSLVACKWCRFQRPFCMTWVTFVILSYTCKWLLCPMM